MFKRGKSKPAGKQPIFSDAELMSMIRTSYKPSVPKSLNKTTNYEPPKPTKRKAASPRKKFTTKQAPAKKTSAKQTSANKALPARRHNPVDIAKWKKQAYEAAMLIMSGVKIPSPPAPKATASSSRATTVKKTPVKTGKRTARKSAKAPVKRSREWLTSTNWGVSSSSEDEAPASEGRRSRRLKHVAANYAASSDDDAPKPFGNRTKKPSAKKAARSADSDDYRAGSESENNSESDSAFAKISMRPDIGRRSRRLRKVGKLNYTAPAPIIPTRGESPAARVAPAPAPAPKPAPKRARATTAQKSPPRRTTTRKPAPKVPATSAAKKTLPRKAAVRKTAPKKTEAKKPTPKKSAAPKKTWGGTKKRPSAAVTATAEPPQKKPRSRAKNLPTPAPAEPPQKKPHTRGKNLPTPGRRADPRVLLERAYAYHDAVMGTTRTDHTYAHAHAHARVIAEGEHLAPTHPAHTHAHAHTAGGSIGMAQATQNASKNTQSGGGGIEGGLGPDSTAHVANGAAGEVMAADVNSTTHAANDVGGSGSVGVGETVADGTSSTSLALHGMGGGVLEEAASAHKAREAETVAKVSSAPAEEQTGLGLETDETLDDEIVGEMSETGERDSPEPASGPVQKDLDSGAAGVGSPLGTTLSASVEAEKEERERDGVQGASHSMGVVDYSSDEDEAATTKNAPDKSADGPIPNKDTVPVRTTAATDTGTQTVEKGTVAMETTEVTTQTADRGIGATKDAATTPETSMTSGATGVAKAKSPVPETARPVVPGVSTMAPFETSRGTTHEATGPSAPETSAPGPTKTGTVEGIAHVGTETASGDSTGPSKGHIPNGSAGVQESNGPIPKMSQPIPIAKESAGDTAAGVAPAKQPTALPSNGKEPSVNGATYTSSDGGGQKTETNDVGQDESLPDNCPDQPGYFLEG